METWDVEFDPTKAVKTRPAAPDCKAESIARLEGKKHASNSMAAFTRITDAIPLQNTATLIVRIESASDPLVLWKIHQELDRRDIPPALRWPGNTDTPTMHFVTWLADVHWIHTRNPHHTPKFRGWKRLFLDAPDSPAWLERAYQMFAAVYDRRSLSYIGTVGLALTDALRKPLMMFPTNQMVKNRQELHADTHNERRDRLENYSRQHPDKSGKLAPHDIANRRASLFRVHLLSGLNAAETAKNWGRLTDERMTRQAVDKQITLINSVLWEPRK